jgi:putative ABC transport system permease protein
MSATPSTAEGTTRAPLVGRDEGTRFQEFVYAMQECLRSALASIRAHTLRSFLTILGVIIGISSVICVFALMQGLTRSITQQFEGLGSSTLTLRSYTPLSDQLRGKVNRLRPSDLEQLTFRIDGITHITPIVFAGQRFGAEVRNGSNVANGQLLGTTVNYQDVFQVYPAAGRFLTPHDDESRRRVVVLGEQMRKDLKLPENPSGHFVQIGSEWFKVVGLMEARGEIFGQNQDAFLVMPYQTALAVTGVMTRPDLWISFSATDPESVDNVKQRVTALMRRLHGLKDDQENDFLVEASETIAKTVRDVSLTLTLVVSGIVGISLLVSGVGIMNIMLVSVTERTREIGIAKALGAPRRYILFQFLMEAMVLAALGGVIGIAFGYGMAFGLSKLISQSMAGFPPPSVPWWAVLGSCAFSALIGMVFGILPATKAANLAPIDALRYE